MMARVIFFKSFLKIVVVIANNVSLHAFLYQSILERKRGRGHVHEESSARYVGASFPHV